MEQTSAIGFHTGKKKLEPGNIKEIFIKGVFLQVHHKSNLDR